jgi:nucleoside-diphosphate-sugar epimerase
MRILVTGSGGKIGRELLPKLKQAGLFVVSLSSEIQPYSDETILVDWDSPTPVAIPEVDFVVHLAGQTSAYKSRANRSHDAMVNLLNILNVLEGVAIHRNLPKFVHIGSLTEYGNNLSNQDKASHEIFDTFYECNKKITWLYINQYRNESLIGKCISLKLANVYGGKESTSRNDRGFIDRVIGHALEGKPITIYGDGEFIRDYIRVEDVVSAIIATLNNLDSLKYSEYQIGTGIGITISKAVEHIVSRALNYTGKRSLICKESFPLDAYSIERRNAISFPQDFISETGWRPRWEPFDGLEELVKKKFVDGFTRQR